MARNSDTAEKQLTRQSYEQSLLAHTLNVSERHAVELLDPSSFQQRLAFYSNNGINLITANPSPKPMVSKKGFTVYASTIGECFSKQPLPKLHGVWLDLCGSSKADFAELEQVFANFPVPENGATFCLTLSCRSKPPAIETWESKARNLISNFDAYLTEDYHGSHKEKFAYLTFRLHQANPNLCLIPKEASIYMGNGCMYFYRYSVLPVSQKPVTLPKFEFSGVSPFNKTFSQLQVRQLCNDMLAAKLHTAEEVIAHICEAYDMTPSIIANTPSIYQRVLARYVKAGVGKSVIAWIKNLKAQRSEYQTKHRNSKLQ